MSTKPAGTTETPAPDQNENVNPDPNNAAPGDGGDAGKPSDAGQEALKILQDIQKNLNVNDRAATEAPKPAQPTYEQIRQDIKERTGWTDAQVDFHLESLQNAQAVPMEKLTWMELEKRFPDLETYRADMNEELKAYPAARRGDPVLLEKIYFMSKGRKMDQTPRQVPSSNGNPSPARSTDVVQRRVAQPFPGSVPSQDTGNRAPSKTLSTEQKELARRMGVPEERYIECMDNKPIRNLKR